MKLELNIPENWNEVNGVILQRIMNINTEEKDEYTIVSEYVKAVINNDEMFDKIKKTDIISLINHMKFMWVEEVERKEFFEIEIGGKTYGLFDKEMMTVNDWIDGINNNKYIDFVNNLKYFLPSIIREVDIKHNNRHTLKRFNADEALIIGEILMEKLKATEIYYILDYYSSAREEIINKYPIFFKDSGEEPSWFHKRWGWNHAVWEVSEIGTFGNVKDVENLRINEFILYLIYKGDLIKKQEQDQKRAEQLNKIKNKR